MECGTSISSDGYGQDRVRIMAILAQDANTDRKDAPSSEPWAYRHLGELTQAVAVLAKMASNACGRRCQFPLGIESDKCQEDCAWDDGHTFERCACVTHINNHMAPPIRKTVDSESFPSVLEAAASRGLHSGHALTLWQSGYRSGASIQVLSTACIHAITGAGGTIQEHRHHIEG